MKRFFAAERGGHAFAAEAAAFPLSDDEEDDQQHDDAGDAEDAGNERRPPVYGNGDVRDEVEQKDALLLQLLAQGGSLPVIIGENAFLDL